MIKYRFVATESSESDEADPSVPDQADVEQAETKMKLLEGAVGWDVRKTADAD